MVFSLDVLEFFLFACLFIFSKEYILSAALLLKQWIVLWFCGI